MAGERHHLPAGQAVYFEAWCLLFGEGGAVAGYCLPARTVATIVAKVLRLPPGRYIDDFIAALLAKDVTAVADPHTAFGVMRVAPACSNMSC